MTRTSITLALLALMATTAQALPSTTKVLAQFDLGYAKCETRFPHMRGHRDDAYLALWKAKPDAKNRAELATVRKGGKYQQERRLALKSMDKSGGAELEEKLKRQCQATWGETVRNAPPAKR
jgi:hypothetical protein